MLKNLFKMMLSDGDRTTIQAEPILNAIPGFPDAQSDPERGNLWAAHTRTCRHPRSPNVKDHLHHVPPICRVWCWKTQLLTFQKCQNNGSLPCWLTAWWLKSHKCAIAEVAESVQRVRQSMLPGEASGFQNISPRELLRFPGLIAGLYSPPFLTAPLPKVWGNFPSKNKEH